MEISPNQKHTLLNIAEWVISDYLETGKRNPLPKKFKIDDVLRIKSGAFVSVYISKKLRGCIGTFSENDPLYKNVYNMSLQAAFEDRRFDPVKEEEISKLDVEISVLSPRKKFQTIDEIEIGKHGIYLIHGIKRATLLPQVAVHNNFSAVEFLECCATSKLGLAKDSWKEAELFIYEAIVLK